MSESITCTLYLPGGRTSNGWFGSTEPASKVVPREAMMFQSFSVQFSSVQFSRGLRRGFGRGNVLREGVPQHLGVLGSRDVDRRWDGETGLGDEAGALLEVEDPLPAADTASYLLVEPRVRRLDRHAIVQEPDDVGGLGHEV